MKRNLLHDGLVAFSFPVSTDRIAVLHLPRDFMDDALLARAEKAEQERDTYKQDYLTRHERWRDAEARAEKAELALAEINAEADTVDAEQPWQIIGPRMADIARAALRPSAEASGD